MSDWRDKQMAIAQAVFLILTGLFLLILTGWLLYEAIT